MILKGDFKYVKTMKILSPLQRQFAKAAGKATIRLFNENAAKMTGVIFAASDALLTGFNYLKNNVLSINPLNPSPDELITMSGLIYMSASGLFLGADRFPWLKRPVGLLSALGGAAMLKAGHGSGTWELYGTSVPPILTGLSMMFEKQANHLGEKLASAKNHLADVGKFYLKYPVATMAIVQNIGAGFALSAGLNNPEQYLMVYYAGLWVAGNGTMALTDDNVRAAVRRSYTPQPPSNNTP